VTTNLIPFKSGRTFADHHNIVLFFPNEEGVIVENLSVRLERMTTKGSCKRRLEAASSSDLFLYLVREMLLFLEGKGQEVVSCCSKLASSKPQTKLLTLGALTNILLNIYQSSF